ncbi:MAG: hypothetical protein VYD90_07160 [Pseudomonadota bacterium]|nr:hypothetical protein [Pseudomonadota bacterium]
MKTHITITEGPLAIFEERDDRTLVYAGENTAEAKRQNELARAMVDGAARDVLDARDDALAQVSDEGNAKIALAQAWAEAETSPAGDTTKSARSWALAAESFSGTAEAFAGPTYSSAAEGLAATVQGDFFGVDSGGLLAIYRHNDSQAELQRTVATSTLLASSSGAQNVGAQGGGTLQQLLDARRASLREAGIGAIGNGTDADGPAFAAAAALAPTKGTFDVPPGTYMGRLNIADGLGLDSTPGAVFKQDALGNNYVIGTSSAGKRYVYFGGHTIIDGNNGLGAFTSAGLGVDFTGVEEIYIESLEVRNCWGHGLRLQGGCQNIFINNLEVHDNWRFGFVLEHNLASVASTSIFVNYIHAYNNGTGNPDSNRYSGINVGDSTGAYGPYGVFFGTVYAHDNERDGLAFGRNASNGNAGPRVISVERAILLDNNDHGIEFYGCEWFYAGYILAKGNAKNGVLIVHGDDFSTLPTNGYIGHIHAEENGYYGLYIQNGENIHIASVTAINNGQSAPDTYDGVSFYPGSTANFPTPGSSLKNISIGTVTAIDTQEIPTQRYGLSLQAGQIPNSPPRVAEFTGWGNASADIGHIGTGTGNTDLRFTLDIGKVRRCDKLFPSFNSNVNGANIRNALIRVDKDYVGRCQTTNATTATAGRILIEDDTAGLLEVTVTARQDGGFSQAGVYKVLCRANNNAATGTFASNVTPIYVGESLGTMDATLTSGGSGTKHINIRVTGVDGVTLNWEFRARWITPSELGA